MSTQAPPIDQNTIRRRGTGLRVLDHDRAFPGYTIFTPLTGQGEVYLIDLEGKIMHQWTLPYRPGLHAYLLPNGNLFYGGKGPEDQRFFPVWSNYRGGVLVEVDPQGTSSGSTAVRITTTMRAACGMGTWCCLASRKSRARSYPISAAASPAAR